MKRLLLLLAGCMAAQMLVACSRHDDVRARYQLERLLWQARFYQRRVHSAFLGASTQDLEEAIATYRVVVAADPCTRGAPAGWDPQVMADIRELEVSARVALANLYFATAQYADAGTLYAQTLRLGSTNFTDLLDVRMGAARASSLAGDNGEAIAQCTKIFREVDSNPDFWKGKTVVDDVFLSIPMALAELQREIGRRSAADSLSGEAMAFYGRVSRTWPGSRPDWQARVLVAQLHMLALDWPAAARDLEAIVAAPRPQAGEAASLRLVLGEIYAFRLSSPDTAAAHFEAVRARNPGSVVAYAAAYDLAALRLAQSDTSGAAEQLRALEKDPAAPDAVAARAMFARARVREKGGDWDEAYALFRRLEQLYPFTSAAIEAPLEVTRHYAATGNTEMLDVAIEHAREYYSSLLERGSEFPGNRAVVRSALTESLVASGHPDEAARFLAAGPQGWDDVSTAAGMLDAAELYRTVLHDETRARETLESVVQRFPGTRYARAARDSLHRLSPNS